MPDDKSLKERVLDGIRDTFYTAGEARNRINLGLQQAFWAQRNKNGGRIDLAARQLSNAISNFAVAETMAHGCTLNLQELSQLTAKIEEAPGS